MSKQKGDLDTFSIPSIVTAPSQYVWVTDFDDDSLIQFYNKFSELEANPAVSVIPVFISSYGGEVATLMAMRDMIKSSPKPVATIAVGKAMSCGACLLAAGTKGFRFASKDTAIMIHEISAGSYGKTTDIAEHANMIAELNRKFMTNLAKDSGRSVKEIQKQLSTKKNADWSLSSHEAREWGFVDHVALPRLTMNEPALMLVNQESYDSQIAQIVKEQVKSIKLAAKEPKKKRK